MRGHPDQTDVILRENMTVIPIAGLLLAAAGGGCRAARPEPMPSERHGAPVTIGSGVPLRYLVLGDRTAAGVGADYERGIVLAKQPGQCTAKR